MKYQATWHKVQLVPLLPGIAAYTVDNSHSRVFELSDNPTHLDFINAIGEFEKGTIVQRRIDRPKTVTIGPPWVLMFYSVDCTAENSTMNLTASLPLPEGDNIYGNAVSVWEKPE